MEQSPKINIESKERISSYNIRVEEIEIGEINNPRPKGRGMTSRAWLSLVA